MIIDAIGLLLRHKGRGRRDRRRGEERHRRRSGRVGVAAGGGEGRRMHAARYLRHRAAPLATTAGWILYGRALNSARPAGWSAPARPRRRQSAQWPRARSARRGRHLHAGHCCHSLRRPMLERHRRTSPSPSARMAGPTSRTRGRCRPFLGRRGGRRHAYLRAHRGDG